MVGLIKDEPEEEDVAGYTVQATKGKPRDVRNMLWG